MIYEVELSEQADSDLRGMVLYIPDSDKKVVTILRVMLMCGKVTHKNLIGSSPLFRFVTYGTEIKSFFRYTVYKKGVSSVSSEQYAASLSKSKILIQRRFNWIMFSCRRRDRHFVT